MPTLATESSDQGDNKEVGGSAMSIRPNELPVDTLERKLSDEIVDFLRAEVAQYGDKVYYWFRLYYLEQGIGLAPYDVAVARFVKKHFSGMHTIEIGAGMAELSALLAAEGLNATAIEKTPSHLTTANNLRTWLGARGYPSYNFLDGWFPDVGRDLTKGGIIIGLSIIHTMPPDRWEALLDSFIDAAGVIIDLATFFTDRARPCLPSRSGAPNYSARV